MWHEKKEWLHYVKNIIASDMRSAVFLVSYLRFVNAGRHYASSLEVVDLQKYKVVRQPAKVRIAMRERKNVPFVFVIGKN